eukprot:CAMPEP_0179868410 /NCGR_PEP_ID=MMETSP0982-20121206/18831_1 /TAXON_ID=483367 /ORGANISM="non described non described, Strain CCMP 2436" /LENGTH=56 /DNA_ID=CAMNT_0021758119 /DNA_START=53 /DNA_END=223 /DNA_ORIENTATION=-
MRAAERAVLAFALGILALGIALGPLEAAAAGSVAARRDTSSSIAAGFVATASAAAR